MWHLKGIFIAGTYMAMSCEVGVVVDFVVITVAMWHLYVDHSTNVVGHICAMCQPYLFRGIRQYGKLQFPKDIYGDCS